VFSAFVKVLNGGPGAAGTAGKTFRDAGRGIGELLSELQELERIGLELCQREPEAKDKNEKSMWSVWPNFKFSDPKSKELDTRGRRILEGINARLRRYQWSPAVAALINEDGLPGFVLSDYVQPTRNTFAFDFDTSCVRALLNLLVDGRLHRIRQCFQCQRSFYAVTDHQKYCADNCRKRHAAYGQSFKEKRRLYMREYRSKEKTRDANAKKLARRK
jgi:hypothetical protein